MTVLNKIESIQQLAEIKATEALKTTPADVLFAHAHMPSLQYEINRMCHAAALFESIISKRLQYPPDEPL
jgi:hypothetical protein